MKKLNLIAALLLSGTAHAVEMPQSAKDIGCSNCHAIDQTVVGPAWMDVSKRYRDGRSSDAVLKQLVKKVSRGGSGNWGNVPMVGSDPTGARHDEVVELVKFILALSDQAPEKKRR